MNEIDVTVPDRSVFVLGDNRDRSRDSRSIGSIHVGDVIGYVDYIFFPAEAWSRFGVYRDKLGQHLVDLRAVQVTRAAQVTGPHTARAGHQQRYHISQTRGSPMSFLSWESFCLCPSIHISLGR